MHERPLPLALPNIGEQEIAAVVEVLRSDSLALGPRAEQFESAIARLSGRQFGIACSSGTAGLHMVVRALDIEAEDEVITTPFSFVASANCILYERAKPVFVDIEEQTFGMDPELADAAWTAHTAGILPVHVFGNPCRIAELERLASDRGGDLIEDACEALGCTTGNRPVGSFGRASVFAFYPNKQITTGEGGMVVTDDPELTSVLLSLRNQGRDAVGTWLRHVRMGFNYRLDEMSAALGLAQLERLAELREGRDRVVRNYAAELADIEWISLPSAAPDARVDWFVFVVRVAPEIDRQRVMDELHARGIPCRPYFAPIHLQPFYRQEFGYRPGDFPVTERVASQTLALPFSSRHSDADIARVAGALREVSRLPITKQPIDAAG
jgi:perosamine synthetase